MRLVVVGLLALLVVGAAADQRGRGARARPSRAGWLESKNLTLAPVVKGLKEPTFVDRAAGRQQAPVRARARRRDPRRRRRRPAPRDAVSRPDRRGLHEQRRGPARPGVPSPASARTATSTSPTRRMIGRCTWSATRSRPDAPDVVDPGDRARCWRCPSRANTTTAGMLAFGPDGYLYVAVGDDEASDKAQDLATLVGKILRLDVDSAEPYAIPPSNPFADRAGARGEIWSYGSAIRGASASIGRRAICGSADVGDAKLGRGRFSAGGQRWRRELRLADERRHRVHRARALPRRRPGRAGGDLWPRYDVLGDVAATSIAARRRPGWSARIFSAICARAACSRSRQAPTRAGSASSWASSRSRSARLARTRRASCTCATCRAV